MGFIIIKIIIILYYIIKGHKVVTSKALIVVLVSVVDVIHICIKFEAVALDRPEFY